MPLGKLLRARFGKDKGESRQVEGPADLQPGDLVTFKHRQVLPPSLQGETLEVSQAAAYEYEDGVYPQLTLDGEAGRIYLSFRDGDASEMSLSRTAPRADVLQLFDEDAFGALWDEDFAELEVATALPAYEGWLGKRYSQTKKSAEGYFHDKDCRGSDVGDDEGEELRYHECEDESGRYGLTVDVYGDGETEVSLDVNCSPDVIESLWPGDQKR